MIGKMNVLCALVVYEKKHIRNAALLIKESAQKPYRVDLWLCRSDSKAISLITSLRHEQSADSLLIERICKWMHGKTARGNRLFRFVSISKTLDTEVKMTLDDWSTGECDGSLIRAFDSDPGSSPGRHATPWQAGKKHNILQSATPPMIGNTGAYDSFKGPTLQVN